MDTGDTDIATAILNHQQSQQQQQGFGHNSAATTATIPAFCTLDAQGKRQLIRNLRSMKNNLLLI